MKKEKKDDRKFSPHSTLEKKGGNGERKEHDPGSATDKPALQKRASLKKKGRGP